MPVGALTLLGLNLWCPIPAVLFKTLWLQIWFVVNLRVNYCMNACCKNMFVGLLCCPMVSLPPCPKEVNPWLQNKGISKRLSRTKQVHLKCNKKKTLKFLKPTTHITLNSFLVRSWASIIAVNSFWTCRNLYCKVDSNRFSGSQDSSVDLTQNFIHPVTFTSMSK